MSIQWFAKLMIHVVCLGLVAQVTEPRHLKAMVTMAGPDVLCVGSGKAAQEVLKRIEREASFSYQTLTVPEDEAANVLHINGTLIHRGIGEVPNSCKHFHVLHTFLHVPLKVFEERVDFPRRTLAFSELAKVGSGLTSCCLLVRRSRHIRHL
ncbi:hypothetical protein B566_EDAN003580 [Ephemera danica]|nr:hypothetical protein B566_EDAN003580 [Ephemera danica]